MTTLRVATVARSVLVLAVAGACVPALATYHLMQIQRVIGGVEGDPQAQAIQIRSRATGQNLLAPARLVARDAAGANPIILFDFASSVDNDAAGATVLIASEHFSDYTDPPAEPDFVMTNLIPEDYLVAGCLSFEDDGGGVLFLVAWGGSDFTGSTAGATVNDSNGDFGPAFGDALPSEDVRALSFAGAASDLNESSATSFALSEDAAEFTNNAGDSFTVAPCTGESLPDEDEDGVCDQPDDNANDNSDDNANNNDNTDNGNDNADNGNDNSGNENDNTAGEDDKPQCGFGALFGASMSIVTLALAPLGRQRRRRR